MLKRFDHLQTLVEDQQGRWFFEARLPYFANEIMETLNIQDADEISLALKRTFEACHILQIPLSRNFRRVYRFNGKELIADWKVSALAHYLIVINCNPANEQVAKAQLYFVINKSVK
jgi:hypothetical protein